MTSSREALSLQNIPEVAPLGLVVLGGGAVVYEYYAPAFQKLGLSQKALIVEASETNVVRLRRNYPRLSIKQVDFRALWKGNPGPDLPPFDAAVIALPNSLHREAVEMALDLGLHVLCEKPLALSREACLHLARKANEANRILAVGMVRRLLPSVSALRDALEEKKMGELVDIDIEDGAPYAWPSHSGAAFRKENGGVLADMGVHYLDLVEALAGKLHPVSYSDDSRGGVETNLEYQLKTQKGIPVRLALSWTRRLRNTLILKGTLGELILEKDTFDACFWRARNSDSKTRLSNPSPFRSGPWPPTLASCFIEELFEFTHAIHHGQKPRVSALEAASTAELIEWAYQERGRNRAKVSIQKTSARPILPPAKTVVTGGTGFIGTRLVERLHGEGFEEIVVPVRNYQTGANIARFPIEMQRTDLLHYEQVRKVIRGARYVFHLAYGREGPDAARVTIEGTKNVIEAAIAEGCESVVVLSTIAVFGYPENKTVDESWPYHPVLGEYGRSKAQMEKWCLERARLSGPTRIVILNPSCVYGPGGKTYTLLPLEMARKGIFCWIEEGRGIANYTYVDNLIDAIFKAAASKEAHGKRFIINDGSTSWRSFLTPFLGPWADPLSSYTPRELQGLQRFWEDQMMNTVKQILRKLTPGLLKKIRESRRLTISQSRNSGNAKAVPPPWLNDLFGPTSTVFSSEKAQTLLGWKPRVDLGGGSERALEWLRFMRLL